MSFNVPMLSSPLHCFVASDFERRFISLLGSAFRDMPPALCLRYGQAPSMLGMDAFDGAPCFLWFALSSSQPAERYLGIGLTAQYCYSTVTELGSSMCSKSAMCRRRFFERVAPGSVFCTSQSTQVQDDA